MRMSPAVFERLKPLQLILSIREESRAVDVSQASPTSLHDLAPGDDAHPADGPRVQSTLPLKNPVAAAHRHHSLSRPGPHPDTHPLHAQRQFVVQQSQDLGELASAQTTHGAIERMHARQDRQEVREQDAPQVTDAEPERGEQQDEPGLQQ
nr:hypothetical protein CFP56_69342 [Quercus suber]